MAKIISFISGKGGAGKSTTAAGVGAALAKKGKRVLLVDCDIGFENQSIITGLCESVVYNWEDVISNRCKPADAIYKSPLCEGLYLLPAPHDTDRQYPQGILADLLNIISNNFDFIFTDSSAGVGEAFKLSVYPADEAILVCTDDAICLRGGYFAADRALKVVKRAFLVLNCFKDYPVRHSLVPNIDEAMDEVCLPLMGVVPYDGSISFRAGSGRTLFDSSAAVKAYDRIADRLCGENIPLPDSFENG